MHARAMHARPIRTLGAALLWLAALAGALRAEQTTAEKAPSEKAAVFPVELFDPGAAYGSRTRPVDAKKLALVTDELRAALKDRAGLDVLDTAPAAEAVARQGPLYKCGGCAAEIAKGLGADLAVTGYVEKGSGQIFNLSVVIAEAVSGKAVRGGQVTIRADTPDDWAHAMRWVVKNRLLAEPLPGKT